MSKLRKPLHSLARFHGVATKYFDISGRTIFVSDDTLIFMLRATGIKLDAHSDFAEVLRESKHQHKTRAIPPTILRVEGGSTLTFFLTLKASETAPEIFWEFTPDQGESTSSRMSDSELQLLFSFSSNGTKYNRYRVTLLLTLPLGYHRLTLNTKQGLLQSVIIIAPQKSYLPQALSSGGRIWGMSTQLSALRSESNWGIGDFSDLGDLLSTVTSHGASFLGLNPLHAPLLRTPLQKSPYSPSSRLALNPIFISLDAIPEWSEVKNKQLTSSLDELRNTERVEIDGVFQKKLLAFKALFLHFEKHHIATHSKRAKSFANFIQRHDSWLTPYALHEALTAFFSDSQKGQITRWPEEYQDYHSEACKKFSIDYSDSLTFYKFLQWHAHEQLGAVTQNTESASQLGLYLDLALGSERTGADVWAKKELYAQDVDVGAPPDDYNSLGQNWGFPPLIPHQLQLTGYKAFREVLQANMQFAGAIRIDHAMSLSRLFWMPSGADARAGTYIRYPLREMAGIVALESHRNKCVVIGEDLGTVTNRFRSEMETRNLFSYKVLMFMRHPDGSFQDPSYYPKSSLALINTHDMSTLPAYWEHADIELRNQLQLPTENAPLEAQHNERHHHKYLLIQLLKQHGALAPTASDHAADISYEELLQALATFLARTDAQLVLVSLEDICKQHQQINLPGITDHYPNWTTKLPLSVEELKTSDLFHSICKTLRSVRPMPHRKP